MAEYAFDIKLWTVCRVEADNEKQAREKMLNYMQCLDIGFDHDGIKVTEASIEDDSGEVSELIEIDGEAV